MTDHRKRKTSKPRKRSPRGSLEFVYAVLPPKPDCKRCGCTNLGYYGQRPENDGAVWKYAKCRQCGNRFIVVFAPEGLDA